MDEKYLIASFHCRLKHVAFQNVRHLLRRYTSAPLLFLCDCVSLSLLWHKFTCTPVSSNTLSWMQALKILKYMGIPKGFYEMACLEANHMLILFHLEIKWLYESQSRFQSRNLWIPNVLKENWLTPLDSLMSIAF